MGAGRIRQALPPLAEAVAARGVAVVWVCDPMHGNTVEAASGRSQSLDLAFRVADLYRPFSRP